MQVGVPLFGMPLEGDIHDLACSCSSDGGGGKLRADRNAREGVTKPDGWTSADVSRRTIARECDIHSVSSFDFGRTDPGFGSAAPRLDKIK